MCVGELEIVWERESVRESGCEGKRDRVRE